MALTNLNYLQTITEGDKDTMCEIIEKFFDQVPEFVGNLKGFLADGKYPELGKEAHKAKSSVMILGMEQLGHDLKTLQLATIAGTHVETYAPMVARFEKECQMAIDELNAELVKLRSE